MLKKTVVKYKPWNSTNAARQTSLAFCLEALSRSMCAYAEHCGLRELSQHEIGTWGNWGRTCSSEMDDFQTSTEIPSVSAQATLVFGKQPVQTAGWMIPRAHTRPRHRSSHNPGKTVTSFHVICSLLMWPSYFYVKEVLIVSPWIWEKFQTSALLPGDARSWNLANTFEDAHTGIWVFSFIGIHTS